MGGLTTFEKERKRGRYKNIKQKINKVKSTHVYKLCIIHVFINIYNEKAKTDKFQILKFQMYACTFNEIK